jgi:hypothetical protein
MQGYLIMHTPNPAEMPLTVSGPPDLARSDLFLKYTSVVLILIMSCRLICTSSGAAPEIMFIPCSEEHVKIRRPRFVVYCRERRCFSHREDEMNSHHPVGSNPPYSTARPVPRPDKYPEVRRGCLYRTVFLSRAVFEVTSCFSTSTAITRANNTNKTFEVQ